MTPTDGRLETQPILVPLSTFGAHNSHFHNHEPRCVIGRFEGIAHASKSVL